MKKPLLFLFIIIISLAGNAQTRLNDHNTIGWYTTTITPSISKKVSLHLEYQWRRVDIIKDWQQSLLRLGVNYKINNQLTAHIGYGFIETFPYGEYNLATVLKTFPGHRIYEQLVITSPVGKSTLTNRLRVEQRWLGRFASIEEKDPQYVFLNRIRFMPKIDIPINSKWYTSLYDEIFIGFGKNIGENIFDQNRAGLLVGYRVNKNVRIDGGYLNQTVQLGREINNKNVFQHNNGIILNTYFNF